MKRYIALLSAWFCLCALAWGVGTAAAATISGHVYYSGGGAAGGTTIQVHDLSTGGVATTTANSAGNFAGNFTAGHQFYVHAYYLYGCYEWSNNTPTFTLGTNGANINLALFWSRWC